MKRFCAWILLLALVFSLTAAQAVTYPEMRGTVNDDAAVLSDSTAQDVETLNSRTSGTFIVVTRHFLGGVDAQEYCDGLFSAWGLGEDATLLLLVIGEERYAVTMGLEIKQAISTEQLNSLLSSRLRQPFLQERDYDAAVGNFLLAAASQVARFQGKSLSTAGLFGTAAAQTTTSANQNSGFNFNNWSSSNWWGSFFSEDDDDWFENENYAVNYESNSGSGISLGKVILIAAVIFIILRSRRRQGTENHGNRVVLSGHQPLRPPRR